jgi:hypothetical protein
LATYTRPRIQAFIPGILCFMLTFYLLTLPGSAFPEQNWFKSIQLDKWIHIGMFATLVGLFYWPYKNQWLSKSFKNKAIFISMLALAYGIVMEFVQKNYIPNRSFDVYDIVADGVGSFLPLFLKGWLAKKLVKTSK